MSPDDQTPPHGPPRRAGLSRHLLPSGPVPPPPPRAALPGYLCEVCEDAPALQMRPGPHGDERGICGDCLQREALAEPTAATLPERRPPCLRFS
jgi:hypothetical protein